MQPLPKTSSDSINYANHPKTQPTGQNAGLSQGAKIGLVATGAGTLLGLGYNFLQSTSSTPTSSNWNFNWPWQSPPQTSDYTAPIVFGLLFLTAMAARFGTSFCRPTKEEKLLLPSNSGLHNEASNSSDISPKTNEASSTSSEKRSYTSSFKDEVDELQVDECGYISGDLGIDDLITRFVFNILYLKNGKTKRSVGKVDELVAYFLDHFVNKLNKKAQAEFLLRIFNRLLDSHPDCACKVAMRIKPQDVWSTSGRNAEEIANKYYINAYRAIDCLKEDKLNAENKIAFNQWKKEMLTTTPRPLWKWTHEAAPEKLLENINQEFEKTNELTETLYNNTLDIIKYLDYQNPKNRPRTCFELASQENRKFQSYQPSESDLNLTEKVVDLMVNFIKNDKNREFVLELANKSLIYVTDSNKTKIAFACIGHDDLQSIVDKNLHWDGPFLTLCLEQADSSEVHKKTAEIIRQNLCKCYWEYKYLVACAEVNNEYSRDILSRAIDEYHKAREKNESPPMDNFFIITEACAQHLLTKERQISEAHRAWIFSLMHDPKSYIGTYENSTIIQPTLQAYMKANDCETEDEFKELLKKTISEPGSTNITEEEAKWFGKWFVSLPENLIESPQTLRLGGI